jgi:hypothetical protein
MLDQLIIFDYIEGAGGEYLSNLINQHDGFYCEAPGAENMQDHPNVLQKFFNANSLVDPNWDSKFDYKLDEFIAQCTQRSITKFAVPYHLYKFPHHVDIIKNKLPVRFIKINCSEYENLVKLDFIKKICFRPLDRSNFNEIKYKINHFNTKNQNIALKLLKNNNLYELDLMLLDKGLDVNYQSRELIVKELLNRNVRPPSQDITINYGDYFIRLDNLKFNYYNLCTMLNIVPNDNLLHQMVTRNQKNFDQLIKFSKDFDIIKQKVFSTQ